MGIKVRTKVKIWMKNSRSYDNLPEVDPVTFAPAWQAWWVSVQPACRRPTDGTWPALRVLPDSKSDWDTVWRGGPCGLFLVIITLAWWLSAAAEVGGTLKDVYDAIEDVIWVLNSAGDMLGLKRCSDADEHVEHDEQSGKRLRTD